MLRIPKAAVLAGAVIAAWSSAPTIGAAEPRVEVVPWSDALIPPPFAGTDDPRAEVPFPPDTLRAEMRPRLQATWADALPTLDGDLADWPVVRWRDARGAGTRVRGSWSGRGDAAMRFALLWTADGIVMGAEVEDDSLRVGGTAENARVESALLYVGSSSDAMTRYWRGAERAFRVWADGRLEGWTRQHNRRPVLFDPAAVGVRGAARVQSRSAQAGRIVVELFVPWDAIFPALPHAQAGLLANVLFEDVDGEAAKLFAWSVRNAGRSRAHAWAHLEFGGGPRDGTWLVSVGSRHVEVDEPYEWSVLRWGGAAPVDAQLLVGSRDGEPDTHAVRLESAANLVRVHDLPQADAAVPWTYARQYEIQLGTDAAVWRRLTVRAVPAASSFEATRADVERLTARDALAFPRPTDVVIRLQRIGPHVEELSDWYRKRHVPAGILVTRAALWAALERRIAEVQLLRDLLAGTADADWVREGLQARWPQRLANGHPKGSVVLRGRHSELDGSVQPYLVYVSSKVEREPVPLVVALHAYTEDADVLFEETPLAREAEARGWIALAPQGRGNTGYVAAGELDVLETIEDVRAQLPVDGTRLYLTGYEMGGTGTWLLSLRHADLFAAAAVVSGFGDMDQPGMFETMGFHPEELFLFETRNPLRLVRPKLQTAYRIVHGERDAMVSVLHARVMADRLREFGVAHELVILPSEAHGRQLFAQTLRANLDALARHRRSAPGSVTPDWFGGVGGPIGTVFARGPFAVVYGTGALPAGAAPVLPEARGDLALTGPDADARTAEQFALEWRTHFEGQPRVLRDVDVTDEIIATHNLVLIGDPRTNRFLAEARDRLPVRYDGDSFELGGHTFGFADAGIVYATASPGTPGKTWIVLSGMPERLGSFDKSLLKLGADFVVTNDEHEHVTVGHFRGLGNIRPQLGNTRPRTKR